MFVEQVKRVDWVDYAMLEMTIIPIAHGMKRPEYEWRKLRWTKTHVLMNSTSGQRMLSKLFELGDGGMAVVCGRPSENLFVIDCDTVDSLNECRRQLVARGIDAPCVYSSRGGHLYLRAREGIVKTIPAGKMRDVEIRGDGAIVILPPTRHESGVYYRWATGQPPRNIPTVSIDEIDFLTDVDGQTVKLATNGGERRLHDATRDYLACGQRLMEGTRNARLFDAARDYEWIGRASRAALYDLLPIATQSGLSEAEATATILSPYKRPHPNPSPSGRGANQTEYLEAFLNHVQWQPRTRKTDKAVFAALIQRRKAEAYTRKDGSFRATVRELKVLARINSNGTITAALNRLVADGYIERVGLDSASRACLFRFTETAIWTGHFFCVHHRNTIQQFSVRSTYCSNLAHPLSESVALGITAMNIFQILRDSQQFMTIAALTAVVNVHRTTVGRNLKTLVELGLVERVGNEYRAVAMSAAEEQALVMDSGAYAADQARRARNDKERALFALSGIIEFLWKRNQEGKS